jgi:glycosyltransferase involved in cell wall biosynthesis
MGQTGEIARQAGAKVVDVRLRKISAVRNVGARVAKGDFFFFVDADTQLSEATFRTALLALEDGAVGGGGSTVAFAEPVRLHVRLALQLFSFVYAGVLQV